MLRSKELLRVRLERHDAGGQTALARGGGEPRKHRLMAEGHTVESVARRLGVSERTVRRRVRAACDAAGVEPVIDLLHFGLPDHLGRFADPAWRDEVVFDYLKQSYLLTARWLQHTVKEVDGVDDKTAQKVDFYTRQYIDALSPTNYLATNPEVLRETINSGGQNLLKGLNNLLDDLESGDGKQLRVRMTDATAFEVGRNLATTPGHVVYQNELMQLIQYTPTTEKVLKRPLLIIWDGLTAHRSKLVREYLDSTGGHVQMAFLPPYSPDLNPIEQAFAKIKHWMRLAQRRSIPDTWRYVGTLIDTITSQECANYLLNEGYASAKT